MAGALAGGKTHSPATIQRGSNNIVNNMLSIIIDPVALGSAEDYDAEVDRFLKWVKSSRPQEGVAEVLVPGVRLSFPPPMCWCRVHAFPSPRTFGRSWLAISSKVVAVHV